MDQVADGGADFIAKDPASDEQYAVSVKFYRSLRVERAILRNAAVQINRYKLSHGMKSLFVASAILDEADQRLLQNIGIEEIWDLFRVAEKAAADSALANALLRLLRDAESPFANYKSLWPTETAPGEPSIPPEAKANGEEILAQLNGTEAGGPDAHKFEQLCCQAIQYLFGEHLGRLHPQNRVEHGFQYMDLLARLTPKETGAFWRSLADDFRCRYIVFEFKNYSDKITQNQIYTTEKYLYPNALRSVAIIIARNGANSGAIRAVQGALREMGKVILVLNLDQLGELLIAKDRGLEPSDLMTDYMDRLLTTIAP